MELYDAATGADLSPPDRHTTHVGSIELTADGTICLACLGYVRPHHAEIVLRDMRTGARLEGGASRGLATAGPGPGRYPNRRPAERVPTRRVGLGLGRRQDTP